MQFFEKIFLKEEESTKPPIIKNDDPNLDKNNTPNIKSIKPPDFTKNINIQDNNETQINQNQSQNNLKNIKPSNQIDQDKSEDQNEDDDSLNGEDNSEVSSEEIPSESEEDSDNLFSNLKPDQMSIKIKELKTQFKNINSVITLSIEKINTISRNTYDDKLIEFIVRKLLQLRDYSKDYLVDTFKTKSYLENQVEFQRLLITFGMISSLFNNIKIGRIERKEEIKKKNNKLFKIKKRDNNYMIFSRGF